MLERFRSGIGVDFAPLTTRSRFNEGNHVARSSDCGDNSNTSSDGPDSLLEPGGTNKHDDAWRRA